MKIKKNLAALVGMLALCLAVVGCGGGSDSGTSSDAGSGSGSGFEAEATPSADEYVGTWTLYEADYEDDDYDADPATIADMAEAGYIATIDLDADGNLVFDMFGEVYEGTWEVKDEGVISIDLEGDTEDCTVEGDLLTLSRDGDSLIFQHTDSTPEMDHSASTSPIVDNATETEVEEGTDSSDEEISIDDLKDPEADANALAYVEDVTEVYSVSSDALVSDDVSVTPYAIGSDYEGDPGVLFTITNNRGDDIFLVSEDDFQVNGSPADATLFRHVNPGETTKAYMFFSQDEVGSADGFTSVSGTISIYDGEGVYLTSFTIDLG